MVIDVYKIAMRSTLLPVYCFTMASLLTNVHSAYDLKSKEYVYVSDDHNNMRRVYNSENIDENVVKIVHTKSSNVYCLYTRDNPHDAEILVYDNDESVDTSNFDPSKVTVFIIHGWLGNRNSTVNTLLTEAFLEDDDVNVIVVDWCDIACSHNYFTTIAAVPAIGHHVGKFILWLATFGVSFEKIHLVGHSLGAHVAGLAGKETKAKVRRITGLDPAGPLWESSPKRLTKLDAQYVEIIHTNTNCLGCKNLNGDVDFFPNGGGTMPGCVGSVCSHSRSYYYMADTVKYNRLFGALCDDMEQVDLDICEGDTYPMGNSDLSKNGSGIFRVDTDGVLANELGAEFESGRRRTQYRRFVNISAGYDCTW